MCCCFLFACILWECAYALSARQVSSVEGSTSSSMSQNGGSYGNEGSSTTCTVLVSLFMFMCSPICISVACLPACLNLVVILTCNVRWAAASACQPVAACTDIDMNTFAPLVTKEKHQP